jgi:hypothetical protein
MLGSHCVFGVYAWLSAWMEGIGSATKMLSLAILMNEYCACRSALRKVSWLRHRTTYLNEIGGRAAIVIHVDHVGLGHERAEAGALERLPPLLEH